MDGEYLHYELHQLYEQLRGELLRKEDQQVSAGEIRCNLLWDAVAPTFGNMLLLHRQFEEELL